MDNGIPPSYEEATMKEPWGLVARYISDIDLCSACLVSKRWHQIFAPWLWGNPAGHFGTENDRVYEIYEGPRAEWLRDVLEQLPNLQSLIVSQLPFFDHASLLMLRRRGRYSANPSEVDIRRFPLRLLIASKCANATSTGLMEACLHLPHLVFLDLSWTTSAREPKLFQTFKSMRYLQVLKLRGIGLRDADIEMIATSVGIRLRSLDVSHNKLTDVSIRILLEKCFHALRDVHSDHIRRRRQQVMSEDWPAGPPRHTDLIFEQFRGSDLDDRFLKQLTHASAGRMLTEDLPQTGLTHLYISNNFITVEGLISLIKTENLHVLDAADIDTLKALRHPGKSTSTAFLSAIVPGVEKLAPILERHGMKNLTYLRIHHSVVTEETGFEREVELVSELDSDEVARHQELAAPFTSRSELDSSTSTTSELATPAPIYELAVGLDTPRYELQDNPLDATSSLRAQKPSVQVQDVTQGIGRGAAFAPEVLRPPEDPPVQLSATGFTYTEQTGHPRLSSLTSTDKAEGGSEGTNSIAHMSQRPDTEASMEDVSDQIAKLNGRRRQIRQRSEGIPRGLLPGSLPALRTLVLTNVPLYDDMQDKLVTSLKKFVSDCATEAQLASSQATLELPTLYVKSRPRTHYKVHRARELFGLSQIVLEMAGTSAKPNAHVRSPSIASEGSESPGLPAHVPGYDGFQQRERSSTGDPDSEAFWRAQENDFTFFGDEECGLPEHEPGRLVPRAMYQDKMSLSPTSDSPEVSSSGVSGVGLLAPSAPTTAPSRGKDVVAELAQWRREKKQASRSGQMAGHWKGEIKIVRPQMRR